jgi:hypothetical protein
MRNGDEQSVYWFILYSYSFNKYSFATMAVHPKVVSAQHHQARVRDYEPHVGREALTISSVRRALSMQILTRLLAANDQAQG